MTHHCQATGCSVFISPRMLMCGRHWRLLPRLLQARVWAAYRAHEETQSEEYWAAVREAVATVAQREQLRVEAGEVQ